MNISDFPPLDLGKLKEPPSYEELQALCARAADALESHHASTDWPSEADRELIAELRKAAG